MRIFFSLLLLLSSAFYFSLALNLEFISNSVPGSGFLPRVTSLLLIIMTGYNFIKEIKVDEGESCEKKYIIDMLKVILVTFFYVLLFNIFGALVSTLLFTITILIIFNKGK